MSEFWILVIAIWLAGSVASYFALRILIWRTESRWMLSDRYIAIAFSALMSWICFFVAVGMTPWEFTDRDVKW